MGFDGFDFATPHEIFDEHARLTRACATSGRRALRSRRSGRTSTAAEYDELEPVQWPMAAVARIGARPDVRATAGSLHADGTRALHRR